MSGVSPQKGTVYNYIIAISVEERRKQRSTLTLSRTTSSLRLRLTSGSIGPQILAFVKKLKVGSKPQLGYWKTHSSDCQWQSTEVMLLLCWEQLVAISIIFPLVD